MHPWPIKRAFVFYNSDDMSPTLRSQISALNPKFSDQGRPNDLVYFYDNVDGFYHLLYKSGTDNYVINDGDGSAAFHNTLIARSKFFGVTNDATSLHYTDDTNAQLLNRNTGLYETVTIKGFGGAFGTASTIEEARIPVYYHTKSRVLNNFSTEGLIQLWIDTLVNELLNVEFATGKKAGGFWLDNMAYSLVNMDLSASQTNANAGKVLEHPTNAKINTQAFSDWYFDYGFGYFSKRLREYFDSYPAILGSRHHKVAMNVATQKTPDTTAFLDKYITFHPADIIFLEFLENPAYFNGVDYPKLAYDNKKKASDLGIVMWETGYMFGVDSTKASGATTAGGPAGYGTFTEAELAIGTVAEHLIERSENNHLLGYPHSWVPTGEGSGSSASTAWQYYNLKPIYAIDFGRDKYKPEGPYCIAQGTDPLGNPYKVWIREFDGGLAVMRKRSAYDSSVTAPTAITFTLPYGNWKQVTDMNVTLAGSVSTTASIRNGQGLLFKRV